MIWLLIFSCLIYLGYLFACNLWRTSIESLSSTYYIWKHKCVFPIFLCSIAFTLLPIWLEVTEKSNFQFLAFIACAGLLFVAVSADYKKDIQTFNMHVISAYVISAAAILWLVLLTTHWYILIGMLILSAFSDNIKLTYIYRLETALFTSTYLCLLLELCA